MDTCPVCKGPTVTRCKCPRGDRWCAQDHHWRPCPEHSDEKVIVPEGVDHGDSDDECNCPKKTEAAAVPTDRGISDIIDGVQKRLESTLLRLQTTAEPIVIDDEEDAMNTCPVCSNPAVSWGRSSDGDRWCAQKHHWQPCPEHPAERSIVPMGARYDGTRKCNCPKKTLPDTTSAAMRFASLLQSQEPVIDAKDVMNTCPECDGPAVSWCRCSQGDRWCVHRHHWKPCPEHDGEKMIVPDRAKHDSRECHCPKKSAAPIVIADDDQGVTMQRLLKRVRDLEERVASLEEPDAKRWRK